MSLIYSYYLFRASSDIASFAYKINGIQYALKSCKETISE